MIPKGRADALTDGIFAFAMTLLVLDLRLPDDFDATSAAALLKAIDGLSGQLVAYVISFVVLGFRWLVQARIRHAADEVSARYTLWLMFYLFSITCVPFSTMVVGRYGDLQPAIWLYAGNTILCAATGSMLQMILEQESGQVRPLRAYSGTATLIFAAVLSVVISQFDPRNAMWAYALTAVLPWLTRFLRGAD